MFASRAHWLLGLGGLWVGAGLAWPSVGGPGGGLVWGVSTLAALALLAKRARGSQSASGDAHFERGAAPEFAAMCVAAALVGVVAQLITQVPRTVWSVVGLIIVFALVSAREGRGHTETMPNEEAETRAQSGPRAWVLTFGVCGLMALCSWLANAHEAAAPSSYAQLRGGAVLGANPRQSIALEYAPGRTVQVVLDDYVEARAAGVDVESLPPEARPKGDPVPEFAERLESRLRASADILEPRHVQGSARAHAALAGIRVESVPASTLSPELTGGIEASRGLRILSGARGPGSRLRVVCPGRLAGRVPSEPRGKCPRKYASEANAGLGLTDNWPGYTERSGSARVGFAALARRFGVESWGGQGLWLALWISVCASVYVFSLASGRRTGRTAASRRGRGSAITNAGVVVLAALTLVLASSALANVAWTSAGESAGSLSRGSSLFTGLMPSALAWRWPLMLALLAATLTRAPQRGSDSARVPLGPLWVLVLVSLAAAVWLAQGAGLGEQLVGLHGGVFAWIELGADLLARSGALSFELARGLLASAALLLLSAALVNVRMAACPQGHAGTAAVAGPEGEGGRFSPVYLLGIAVLAWCSVRKPGLFNALVLGAWLGLEVQQRRARPRP